jgi:hypothetical protein
MKRPTALATWLPALWLASTAAFGQAAPGLGEAQLKAAFIYRFAQYTRWPAERPDFTYCVAGDADLHEAMRRLTRRPLGDAVVNLRELNHPSQTPQCQLLVLAFSDRDELRGWQQALADAPILVVADSPEAFRAGASIAFVVEPNGLAFRVNNSEAKRRGLVLSSQMLKLAREVR